ncbi:MAG: hypothetical protein IH849_05110, partial [Acidobacteria bacterium]|nr:hypothetical protein [Acidobacteriota bacterium]
MRLLSGGKRPPRRRRTRSGPSGWRPLQVLVLGATALLGGCSGADSGSQGTALEPPIATFVGSRVCAGCHVEQNRRWQASHHDRAMEVASAESVLGDFEEASFEHLGRRTRFFRRGAEFLVETAGDDGRPAEFEIAYTFGVEPLQQYLIGFPDGRYQALDVAWDSRPSAEGGQRWFHLQPDVLYEPGDPLHWTGVAYNWNLMCADCHSTGFAKNYAAATDRYESSFAEIDVACESCHGPGSAHVDWAAGLPAQDKMDEAAG